MLLNEAKWLGSKLDNFSVTELSPLVNLGSSTQVFREKGQQFIYQMIFEPLNKRGVEVIHVDLEDGEGVDIVGDIFDPKVYGEICSHNPRAVMCANILEHVDNPAALANLCVDIIPKNGLIFVTVPNDFPYHLAPIDTMFRPTPEELIAIFPKCRVLFSEVVESETFGQQLIRSPLVFAKHLARMMIPFPTFQHWKAAMQRNKWLFRNYRTSCVALEKIE